MSQPEPLLLGREAFPGRNGILRGKYPNAGDLYWSGPLVPAEWCVPAAHAKALSDMGLPVPPPIRGVLLVDTGANDTSIADTAASELGLRLIRTVKTGGMHGEQHTSVYRARLRLPINLANGQVLVNVTERDALACVGIENIAKVFGLQMDGVPVRTIGLLGREFLTHCVMHYDGTSGSFEIHVNLDHLAKNVPVTTSPSVMPTAPQFPKVGRNEPCPCGSGKKYKNCHRP